MMYKNYDKKMVGVFSPVNLVLLLVSLNVSAATVSGGALTLNLDRDAMIVGTKLDNYPDSPTPSFQICCRPSIYVEEFFDASAAAKSFQQLRDENTPDLFDMVSDEISATGLQFAVNHSTLPINPVGRQNRATTFDFDSHNLFGTATGSIGLGGVIRFRVDTTPRNNRVLIGDFTMEYDPAQEGTGSGRSGWRLTNHIGWDAIPFELYDVTTDLIGNSLTVNGNLGFGEGLDHLGSAAARLNEARIGTFGLQTTVVPLPASIWLFAGGLAALRVMGRANKRAG
ncbi:MAG: VPLPA-CTERM sorting domain-containing protein [Gammaproteobacteria bacterium]